MEYASIHPTMFLFYCILLVAWIPLVSPALRMRGLARVWVLTVAVIGACALVYEGWMSFVWAPSVTAPIRIDVLLLIVLLIPLYASGALVLLGAGRRRLALVFGTIMVVVVGGIGVVWFKVGREMKLARKQSRSADALLFAAKFRNRGTYEDYFGLDETLPAVLPVGHFAGEAGSHYTRLVIGSDGRAWLFWQCWESECDFGPGDAPLQPVSGVEDRWQVEVKKRGVGGRHLDITRQGPDLLSVDVGEQTYRFHQTRPPIPAESAAEALTYLGTFAQAQFTRAHADTRQVWLWRSEAGLRAVGIFETLLSGRPAEFTHPMVMGLGTRDGEKWHFQWERGKRKWKAELRWVGPSVAITLERDGRALPPMILEPGAYFSDEAVELASLTSDGDWDAWFETVLATHFSAGEVPACPRPVSGELRRGESGEYPIDDLLARLAPNDLSTGWEFSVRRDPGGVESTPLATATDDWLPETLLREDPPSDHRGPPGGRFLEWAPGHLLEFRLPYFELSSPGGSVQPVLESVRFQFCSASEEPSKQ